jgi:hypothetical protein
MDSRQKIEGNVQATIPCVTFAKMSNIILASFHFNLNA